MIVLNSVGLFLDRHGGVVTALHFGGLMYRFLFILLINQLGMHVH